MKPSVHTVEIDTTNPLADGLVGFFMQGEQVFDAVSQSVLPKFGAAGEVSTSEGIATLYNGTTRFVPPAPTDQFNVDTVTVTVIAANWKTTGRPIHEPIIGKGDNQYAMKGASGALEFFTYRPTTYFEVSYAPTEGQTFIASGTANDDFLRLYVDGVEVDTQADTGAGLIDTSAFPLELGRNSQNTGRYCSDQEIVMTCIHNRVLSAAEVAALHADPYQVLKTKLNTVHEFEGSNGTPLSSIIGGKLAGGGLGGALSDLQTNGSGAAQNVNDFTTVGLYKDAGNRSLVEIPSTYTGGTTSYVAPLIACDDANEGYKPLLVLDTGTTYNRVQFSKDGTFLSSPFLTTPLDISLGNVALDLSISGTTLTCDVYQNGALHESVSVTDGTPLTREGAGIQFAYQGSQEQALSWSVELPVGGLVQRAEVPSGLSAVGTLASAPTAGNLLIFAANNSLSFASVTTPPAGFTALTSYDGSWKNFWYYKISDGTETTAQLDWSHSGGYGHYLELVWQKGTPVSVQTTEDETNVGASNPGPQTTGSLTPDANTNLCVGQVTASVANLANNGQVWTGLSSVAAIPNQSNPGTSIAVAADQSGATSGSLDWTDGSPGSYGALAAFNYTEATGTLASDLSATGTLSATLAAGAATLASDLTASGTLSALLTVPADTLQSDLTASGTLSAALTVPADTLQAGVAATGTLSALLTLPADTLQADLSASGAITAALTIPADALSADLVASGTIAAALTTPGDTLTADLTATGTLAALLTVPADTLQTDLSASGTISAALTLGDTLAADLVASGTLAAALTVPGDTLATDLSASGTLAALLTLPTDTLATDLSASGAITATLTLPADPLAADLSASGVLTGRLTIPVLVSGWEIELQGALYGVLSNATDISDLGAQVYDDVPEQDSTFPYVTIGEALHNEWDTDTELGIDATVTIHVWSRYRGRKETKQLQDAIYRALHRAEFAVGNYNLVTCDFNSSETLVETDGKTRHGVQVFRVLLDDAA